MEVFEEFRERGIISEGMNATFIVLIVKKEGAMNFSDFRSISLVRSLYKIITKVLSMQLRIVMEVVVSSHQGAFVKGRLITDGIFIAKEMVDGRGRRKELGLVCKIDMERHMIGWIGSFSDG